MTRTLGVVMDPIGSIHVKKDSTLAMMLAAQKRGWSLRYMELHDLFMRDGQAMARMRDVNVADDEKHWYDFGQERTEELGKLDAILMRKDPPFDIEYIYSTYILEHAKSKGTLVVNDPRSLRDANEKFYASWFPQCTPPTLITRDPQRIKNFVKEHGESVIKPLDIMGGQNVFRLQQNDSNTEATINTMTKDGTSFVMTQKYIPEILTAGDKRILLIDGEPVPYALARMPKEGDWRGNLAQGGKGVGVPLSDRDRWICSQVGPKLREVGLTFVGLDVIGDYLTEINVTSPTCIRELDKLYKLDIAGQLMDAIDRKLKSAARGQPSGPSH